MVRLVDWLVEESGYFEDLVIVVLFGGFVFWMLR